MRLESTAEEELSPETRSFYRGALGVIQDAQIPFLVGGAYSLAHYAGIVRHTKDLDVFVRPADCARTLGALEAAGFRSELTFPHWLGKAYRGEHFIDVIFRSGNGLAEVDDEWFEHSGEAEVMGRTVRLCPPEESLWTKAFVMERERFDGADVAHLILARGPGLDWGRLLRRFGPHWHVLLAHLILFGYMYPSERTRVPGWLMAELLGRMHRDGGADDPGGRLCRGTFLSRQQYLADTRHWGYRDARLRPSGPLSAVDVERWTAAIGTIP
jgi:hypothetical protein